MGAGSWSASTYSATTARKVATGTSFAYSSAVRSGTVAAKVHDDLDPKKVAGPSSALAGKIVREARDSVEHPTSVPIAVFFDETGSMGEVPVLMQTKLAELFALLLRKGYVEHPQLLVGAYGDANNWEAAPLQVGQFESDNRADEDLDKIYLEGNGGGNGHETAALAWYFLGRYGVTDAWEKRGKKGYIFTIGDETTSGITREMVQKYIDPNTDLEGSLTPQQVVDLVSEKWEIFHIIIDNYAAKGQQSLKHYTKLLGENAIALEDPAAVAEVIATTIGVAEGTIDLDEGLDNLNEISPGSAGAVGKALAKRGGGSGRITVARTPGDLTTTEPPADRL